MTALAQTIASDFWWDLKAAKRYASMVAQSFKANKQDAQALEYELAAASIDNKIMELKASSAAGSFDMGMKP